MTISYKLHFNYMYRKLYLIVLGKKDSSFIHSFIYLLNKTIVKSAVKRTIEQDSKDKALTAAQKLKLHKNYISNRN